ncbi:hypothetical protein PQQ52_25000 [Paraburkholderia sediminicola]|uniref:hypothetical protein n=1 Tax=Paraburkholderia sediminicola TaxID=458836 RepID=UPI0038B6C9F1
MNNRITHGGHTPEATQLQEQTTQLHHTQQTTRSQKLQHTRMQQARVRHSMLAAKFALNKRWAHSHGAGARGPLAQKVATRFGTKPTPKGAAGKGAGLRAKDKELHDKEALHDQDTDKELHEQPAPRERDQDTPKQKERDREKDRQQEQRQPDKERQKDGESQQKRNGGHGHGRDGGNGGNGGGNHDDDHPHQQQQQSSQQQSQQQSQQPPQQQSQQQPRQHPPREGKNSERGAPKFAVTGRKISTTVKVPENFQVLGAKLDNANSIDTARVLLQTFAKVVLRLAAQLECGFALAPLMVLNATSPGAMRRSPARMQSQIASAMFSQQRAPAGGTVSAKASAGVGILSHSLDLTMARKRFSVGYPIDDQSLLSVRQLMIDVKAAMPALAASNGVPTASDKPSEVRVVPAAPGTGS